MKFNKKTIILIGLVIICAYIIMKPIYPESKEWYRVEIHYYGDVGCLRSHPSEIKIDYTENQVEFNLDFEKICEINDFSIEFGVTELNKDYLPYFDIENDVNYTYGKASSEDYRFKLNVSSLEENNITDIKAIFKIHPKYYLIYSIYAEMGVEHVTFKFKEGFFGYECEECFHTELNNLVEDEVLIHGDEYSVKKYILKSITRNFLFYFNPKKNFNFWIRNTVIVLILSIMASYVYDLFKKKKSLDKEEIKKLLKLKISDLRKLVEMERLNVRDVDKVDLVFKILEAKKKK